MIALDNVVLRDDVNPRLDDRDDELVAQYADFFDALPAIEINQKNEFIDGWHRVRAAEFANRMKSPMSSRRKTTAISASNELLTSAAAMCFRQELMIWYQG